MTCRSLAVAFLLHALASVPLRSASAESAVLRIELDDGRSFGGQPVSFRDGIVVLRTQVDSGEVEQGFPERKIVGLDFSDTDAVAKAIALADDGRLAEALPHLEEIWLPRAPFLPLLDQETIGLLAALPAAHLQTGDPYRTIVLAQRLLPHAETPKLQNRIHESILFGHYRLKLYKETETLAREWIRQQPPFPTSALGWKILGDLALREENFEQLTWIALQPIALAGPQRMDHLNGCYGLAIHAFHHLEETERAARLYQEMGARGLEWPPDETLAQTGQRYAKMASDEPEEEPAPAEADLDLRPPEEELNLPIRQVRKSLRTDSP